MLLDFLIIFQSTHSAGNATNAVCTGCKQGVISIHAFRRECDRSTFDKPLCVCHFNPRIPQGMRLAAQQDGVNATSISIHAFRRECDNVYRLWKNDAVISIHAFRRECDGTGLLNQFTIDNFNPRIPQGMRLHISFKFGSFSYFNPRIPQGMRRSKSEHSLIPSNFNPRIPQGMRRFIDCMIPVAYIISIHAFRRECDIQVRQNRF